MSIPLPNDVRRAGSLSEKRSWFEQTAFPGWRGSYLTHGCLTYVPVQALWGCTAEFIEPAHPRRPAVTRLRFPTPLREGERAHFASEIIDENIHEERQWIDVDVDHHGIARGEVAYGGLVPISGLTIRVRFDQGHIPEAVWWYAELNENERYDRPSVDDPRMLKINGQDLQYTFTEGPCQPRESYGLAFGWPAS